MQLLHDILNQFKPLGLADIQDAQLMDRIDTKFAFKREELIDILKDLLPDYYILMINNKRISSYQSLYFDDAAFSFYHDHHNAKIHRFKVRFRKYVDSELYFLEVKEKKKGRVTKRRIPVERFEHELHGEEKAFVDEILGNNSEEVLSPKLWNTYNRITLVSRDKKERLTLDLDLVFSWEGEERNYEDIVIAELKQERLNRDAAFYQLMKKRSIRPYRLSKYCIGTIELHAERRIKYNRFKQKLLKIKGLQK
jgi:hypothetical protein